ncbi:MAG: M20 family metallopeptidase [Armatimonadota bacterium]|nr:M20 family metallopeptidase [Armatimonadota bacterium]
MDEQIVETLRSGIQRILPAITDLRHSLHAEPELGLETVKTSLRICEALSGTSIVLRDPLLGNDVIGELRGNGGKTVCLRADIDAVPVQEQNDLPYKSKIPGIMHACGHDGHTAMLVGAALVLDSLRDHLSANVRFVFQPGEEVICAGKTLVERGACDGCDAAYAIHDWPGLPLGCVSSKEEPLFAAGSHFEIRVKGKGCHGAMPERGRNPIPAAARIVERLRQMHIELNAAEGAVISVCSFQSGNTGNVIPDTAKILGTTRYLSQETGSRIEKAIRKIVTQEASEANVTAEMDNDASYDLPVLNTSEGYRITRELAERYCDWREAERPYMTMDDFAYYLKGREGAMFLLGLGESAPDLHSPAFDFNDEALGVGILMLCLIALSY